MTSSLVGSEMCIRDSLYEEGGSKMHGIARYRIDKWVAAGEPIITTKPVSYTHLTLPTICSV
eukprot:3710804-Prorocentrum_lima.AAC.1